MSFSTLLELEACPRRWALHSAEYLQVWNQRGYPRSLQPAALEGTVVHLALETITRALAGGGCPSVEDASAIATLKDLGGYTTVIGNCIERALRPYDGNPRAAPAIDRVRRRLSARIPEFRSRVQSFLSRIPLEARSSGEATSARLKSDGVSRGALQYGSHAEMELKVPELGWKGIADLLTLSEESCEIRDFKTGSFKEEHQLQLQVYALLWSRDSEVNPTGRLADKLVLSYEDGDRQVSTPTADALRSVERDLVERSAASLAILKNHPPLARPSPDNCGFCGVRHLCSDYWPYLAARAKDLAEVSGGQFGDLEMRVTARHGPTSWDGVVEACSTLKNGQPILLRTANLAFDLQPGLRIRVLNVRLSLPPDEAGDAPQRPAVATMGAVSETFIVPE